MHHLGRVGAGDVPDHGLRVRSGGAVLRAAGVLRSVLRGEPVPGCAQDQVWQGSVSVPVQDERGERVGLGR